jgi:hypothetical protein
MTADYADICYQMLRYRGLELLSLPEDVRQLVVGNLSAQELHVLSIVSPELVPGNAVAYMKSMAHEQRHSTNTSWLDGVSSRVQKTLVGKDTRIARQIWHKWQGRYKVFDAKTNEIQTPPAWPEKNSGLPGKKPGMYEDDTSITVKIENERQMKWLIHDFDLDKYDWLSINVEFSPDSFKLLCNAAANGLLHTDPPVTMLRTSFESRSSTLRYLCK